MQDVVLKIIIFIEVWSWYRLVGRKLEFKFSEKLKYIPVLLFVIVVVIRDELVDVVPESIEKFGPILTFVIIYFIVFYFYKGKLFMKFIWHSVYLLILIVTELVGLLMMMLFTHSSYEEVFSDSRLYMITVIFSKIMLVVIVTLITYRDKKREKQDVVSNSSAVVVVVLLNLIFVLFMVDIINEEVWLHENIEIFVGIVFAILLAMSFLTLIIIYEMNKRAGEEIRYQLMNQQLKQSIQNNDEMVIVYDNLRSLRHDMNNHLGLIKSLCEHNEYQDIDRYIDDLFEDLETANETFFHENTALNVMLNTKISRAKASGIDIVYQVNVNEMPLSDKEVCSLLGNVLDNAIEASVKCENEKVIDLSIQEKKDVFSITCENSYAQKPNVRNGKFLTSKVDSNSHGIGIESIKAIVERHEGYIGFEIEEYFRIEIKLKK